MTRGIDRRLRRAIDASVGWYEDLFALHGAGSTLENGLWSSLGTPPPLHSDAVTVEPGVAADEVMHRLAGRPRAGFKDSFASVDAEPAGMKVVFRASWIHREPDVSGTGAFPEDWSIVRTAGDLAEWTSQHDTASVLLTGAPRPSALQHPRPSGAGGHRGGGSRPPRERGRGHLERARRSGTLG